MDTSLFKPLVLATALSITACTSPSRSDTNPYRIPIADIDKIFENMSANGVYLDRDLLYGYFFTDRDSVALRAVASILETKGFGFAGISADEEGLYWLSMERVERHTPASLHALNTELYEIAEKHHLASYDGFDVGNPEKGLPLERDTYVVREEFKVSDGMKAGSPSLSMINVGFERFPHKGEFCHFIDITTDYPVADGNKLPDSLELERLDRFEQAIESRFSENAVKHYYVFRETHAGKRNFQLVTNDGQKARKVLERVQGAATERKFEFQLTEDTAWTKFNELKSSIQ